MDALYKFSAFAGTIPRRVRYAEGGAYAPVRSTDRRVARSSPTRREYFVCNHRPAGARPAIAYAGQYADPAGLWSMGLGIVIGWDKSHGWSVGLGAASEFGGSKGSSFNTSYTWNQDGSNSFSLGASGSVQLAYFPIAMNFGGGYSYNSYSGHTLSTQTGACFGYQDAVCSGNEVGGSLYWDNHGSFMGATAFAENYVEVAGGMLSFSNGYEKGFMGMEGRGLYAGGNVGGLYAEYSQNGGWNYGGAMMVANGGYDSEKGWDYNIALVDLYQDAFDESQYDEPEYGEDLYPEFENGHEVDIAFQLRHLLSGGGAFGTNYVGATDASLIGFLPLTGDLDRAAYWHDMAYLCAGAGGAASAFTASRASLIVADFRLSARAFKSAFINKSGGTQIASYSIGTGTLFGIIGITKILAHYSGLNNPYTRNLW